MKDEANEKGASISPVKHEEYSDTIGAGLIIKNDTKVEVGGTLNYTVSRGKNILLEDKVTETEVRIPVIDGDGNPVLDPETGKPMYDTHVILDTISWDILASTPGAYYEEQARDLCKENNLTIQVEYVYNNTYDDGKVISARRSDDTESDPHKIKTGTYCPQETRIIVTVVDKFQNH